MRFVAHGLGARRFNPNIVVAIVATAEPVLDRINVMYEPFAKYRISYFQNDGEANEWAFQKSGVDA